MVYTLCVQPYIGLLYILLHLIACRQHPS